MMAFNPAAAFSAPQLLATPQPTTPVRTEPSSGSVPPTSHSDLNDAAVRFLTPSGPLIPGVMPVFPEAAFRAAMAQGTFPFPGFYPGLPPAEVKPEMMFMDPSFGYHPYDGARRKNATRETTAPLKSWLYEHKKNPYPTKGEKIMLALVTKMTLTQVSTWFANARRRLKKENKMTWSPRNRPGEDDDDDLADAEPLERDPCDRPSSSGSNISEINGSAKPENLSNENSVNNNNEKQTGSTHHNETSSGSPRKNKIWSIADTLSTRAAAASTKKEDEAASTSAEKLEDGDSENARVPSASASTLSPNGVAAQPPYMLWPQMAIATMARMPLQRQDFFAMMAQASQVRPPLIFNPSLLMHSLGASPITTSVTPTTPQLNGMNVWNDRQSTSPTSSTHSAAGGSTNSSAEHEKSS